jgi:hypothetical protein
LRGQLPSSFAERIKKEAGVLTAAVGLITEAAKQKILTSGKQIWYCLLESR